MDEIKAIEKSVSELRTIHNRLKKVLKESDWALSVEIPRLNALISEKEEECKSLQAKTDLFSKEIESIKEKLHKSDTSLQESQKLQLKAEKD